MQEDVTPVEPPAFGQPHLVTKIWTLHIGESFTDVSNDVGVDPFYPKIETILHKGVTGGCGDGTTFCPLQNTLRQEMAVFLLKGFLGSDYVPPACTPPGQFTDVPCPGIYTDFIEDLKTRNITAGCGDGTTYCPDRQRPAPGDGGVPAQDLQGGDYVPPACTPREVHRRAARASTRTSSGPQDPRHHGGLRRRNHVLPDGPRHAAGDGGVPLADLQSRLYGLLVADRTPNRSRPGSRGRFL
jgi:hypothetical protein